MLAARARSCRKGSPYLVVYPFVKVRPWYALPPEDRQRAMDEHIRIGREEFPSIKNHTTYSFGIDDQEFMTAFECDEPADFMHLMLRLRESEASRVHRARHADLRRQARNDPRSARRAGRRGRARRALTPAVTVVGSFPFARAKSKRGKDAGSADSSAIGATEDAATRRFAAAAGGQPGPRL